MEAPWIVTESHPVPTIAGLVPVVDAAGKLVALCASMEIAKQVVALHAVTESGV